MSGSDQSNEFSVIDSDNGSVSSDSPQDKRDWLYN